MSLPASHPPPVYITWSLMIVALLLSGCLGVRSRNNQVELNLTEFLPAEWQPLGGLQAIDIDDDATTEYLMLYAYDQANGNGPAGALVLDLQTELVVTQDGSQSVSRPTSFPNPYAILPSYWQGAGQGFIAAPGQHDNIAVNSVAYGVSGDGGATAKADVLILRGGNQYLTFVWWENVVNGYGVSQIFAPGWFEGIDWTLWQRTPEPITSIDTVAPLNNRSLFCRKTRYVMVELEAVDALAYRQPVHFAATDLGIHFCFGIPTHPFYPEGVVLAYLLDAHNRTTLLADALQGEEAQGRLNQIFNPDMLVRVEDVLGYTDIPVTEANSASEGAPLTTSVCAKIVLRQPEDETQMEKRWLLFILQHQPPRQDPPTPDRLYIGNVNAVPAPAEGVELECSWIINQP